MAERAGQLTLSFPVAERLDADDFLVSGSNAEAYSAIERWPDWPDPVLLLIGPTGSGKTHLATIWAKRSHAWLLTPKDVQDHAVPHLVSAGALVIDHTDAQSFDEAALFHLLNAARARRTFLLITARQPPDLWGLTTPDLLSRLRLAPLVSIGEPDDALLRSVLVKMFLDRQLVVDTAVVDALAQRGERSFDAARQAVEALDKRALASGKRITRAMVMEWLNNGVPAL